jgi:hypothetical protein
MVFIIKKIVDGDVQDIAMAVRQALSISRFMANVEELPNKVKISNVRLKKSKHYCGNHPLSCPVRPGGPRPHKHMKYLEGADWVAFNDMINDILDSAGVSANVASSHVIIRKGAKRCIEYISRRIGMYDNEWVKDSGCFENRIGKKSGRSEYPPGTPGIAEYLLTPP